MRLPPYRYPGYYSLRQMLVESFIADRASGAVAKVVTGAKQRVPRRQGQPELQGERTWR
jgi:hypothetical protein